MKLPPLAYAVLALFGVGLFVPVFEDSLSDEGMGLLDYVLLFGGLVVLALVLLAEADVPGKVASAYTSVLREFGTFASSLVKIATLGLL